MRRRSPRSLISDTHLDAPHITEARRLVQNLLRRGESSACRSYLVTSASRGEGKSTICWLLALATAQFSRRRTLLIDGDLRRPSLHRFFQVEQAPGLSDLLRGLCSLDQAVKSTPIPTLSVLPSGRPAGPPHEVFVEETFAAVVRETLASFDLVFIDSAPVVSVPEPLLMADHVDRILMVAMAGRTPIALVRRAREVLEPVASKVAGLILNNAVEGLPYYYDYRHYGYTSEERRHSPDKRRNPAPREDRFASAARRRTKA